MPRRSLVAGVALLAGLAAACTEYHGIPIGPEPNTVGSGRFISESRPVQSVTRVVASAGLRVRVTPSAGASLDITAEDNILPLVDSTERDGTLTLSWKAGAGGISAHGVEIRVGTSGLRGVDASSGSQIDVSGIAGNDFSVQLSGGAQWTGAGSVERLDLNASGGSRITAPTLTAQTVAAKLSGGSSAFVRVVRSLAATVSGGSLLEFLGDPVVDANVADASIVRRVGP